MGEVVEFPSAVNMALDVVKSARLLGTHEVHIPPASCDPH